MLISTTAQAESADQQVLHSAQLSFAYIHKTLHIYNTTGRIAIELGLDGADYAAFLSVLQRFHQQFAEDFNSGSHFCRFFLSTENADLSAVQLQNNLKDYGPLLPALAIRNARYHAIDMDFQNTIADEFGSFLLDDLLAARESLEITPVLPISTTTLAEKLALANTLCE